MSLKHTGKQTISLLSPPSVLGYAGVVGKKEGEGPLASVFDLVENDAFFGESSFEKAESRMLKRAMELALDKAGLAPSRVEYAFAGDLLNQCTASAFAVKGFKIPYFGLYGACSTMAEGLALAALTIDGGFADICSAASSSHFCSAERQYRFPLGYGGQRTPTAQWTVTGSGAVILGSDGPGPYITHVTPGRVIDTGITDANNMGAAMAPAACDTLAAHFEDLRTGPDRYDLIVTGDLGSIGASILTDMLRDRGFETAGRYNDCGLMIFDTASQDVHAGGSGCGCSAAVLCGHLLDCIRQGRWDRILFAGTGALMSPTSCQQGCSIPGICCAVSISKDRS
ncbi:MAG: stage V sporulation protein AD [Oscillospiraceae bacterium]|nr:stage V sporulation protein AD [Oscillospiraceae bacterium]